VAPHPQLFLSQLAWTTSKVIILINEFHRSIGERIPTRSGIYWLLFATIAVLLSSVRLAIPDHFVFQVKPVSNDFLQVFFQSASGYSEADSMRSAPLTAGVSSRVEVPFRARRFTRLRLDPGNQPGDMLIEKIELHSLFGKNIWSGSELMALVRPVQMVGYLRVTPAGLLVHATGNDPVLELELASTSVVEKIVPMLLLSAGAAWAGVGLMRLRGPSRAIRSMQLLAIFGIPLLYTVVVAALFYPGFMSYDTLHALAGARKGVSDSMWPPMVSYIWRGVDWLCTNPAAMHFSQIGLLLFSLFFCVRFLGGSLFTATLFLSAYLTVPVILGTLAVIWKDVLMAAFLMAGFVLTLAMPRLRSALAFRISALGVIALLFIGTCCRHNAITGAVPLILYLAWIVCRRECTGAMRRVAIIAGGAGMTLVVTIFYGKVFLDNYALPGFVPMASSSGEFIQTVRALDVAGASVCVGKNLFGSAAPKLSLDDINKLYDARHINLSKALLEKIDYDAAPGINSIWRDTALHHPICFFNNKLELTKYMVGANAGEQFIITAPAIDTNEYGYRLTASAWRDLAVTYINQKSNWTIFRPWFLYLIAVAILIRLSYIGAATMAHGVMFLSGLFYFGGLVAFGNAADARLLFYTTTIACLLIAGAGQAFFKRQK
jgi:hypothetical protein